MWRDPGLERPGEEWPQGCAGHLGRPKAQAHTGGTVAVAVLVGTCCRGCTDHLSPSHQTSRRGDREGSVCGGHGGVCAAGGVVAVKVLSLVGVGL